MTNVRPISSLKFDWNSTQFSLGWLSAHFKHIKQKPLKSFLNSIKNFTSYK